MSDPKEYTYYLVHVAGEGFVGNHHETYYPDPRDAWWFETKNLAEDEARDQPGELVTVRFTTTT